jgi:hypothetical protein
VSYDFYLHGRARSAEHFNELCTALRTFDFEIVAAYAAAVVQAVPPIVVVPPPPSEHPEPVEGHNFAPRINQQVIDLFRAVFGSDFWTVVTRAGLAAMAASPAARQAAYTGPDVEDLPLGEDERARLIAAL